MVTSIRPRTRRDRRARSSGDWLPPAERARVVVGRARWPTGSPYPWELYPYAATDHDVEAWVESVGGTGNPSGVQEWFARQRDVYRSVLLDIPQERSYPVLSDPLGPLGTSGLMGNVKEWCDDSVGKVDPEHPEQRAILGATAFLGEGSFSFEYGTPLFPRNTNPDVGFRVCRPLSSKETEVLKRREASLRGL